MWRKSLNMAQPYLKIMNSFQHKETSDQYLHIMCHLNLRWRVIRCRHDLQWIIQRRSSADLNKGHWIGQSYHMTLESLRASCLGVTGLQNDKIEALIDENLERTCLEYNFWNNNGT